MMSDLSARLFIFYFPVLFSSLHWCITISMLKESIKLLKQSNRWKKVICCLLINSCVLKQKKKTNVVSWTVACYMSCQDSTSLEFRFTFDCISFVGFENGEWYKLSPLIPHINMEISNKVTTSICSTTGLTSFRSRPTSYATCSLDDVRWKEVQDEGKTILIYGTFQNSSIALDSSG